MESSRTWRLLLRRPRSRKDLDPQVLTISRPPGLVLSDILQRTGGVYETTIDLSPQMRDDLREVAELTSDERLRKIADLSEVPVPLGHLRHLDLQTRIVVGARLDYTYGERRWLSRRRQMQPYTGIACLLGDYVVPGDSEDAQRDAGTPLASAGQADLDLLPAHNDRPGWPSLLLTCGAS
jgi:hypothetical protein